MKFGAGHRFRVEDRGRTLVDGLALDALLAAWVPPSRREWARPRLLLIGVGGAVTVGGRSLVRVA